jgi:hypothetical protein
MFSYVYIRLKPSFAASNSALQFLMVVILPTVISYLFYPQLIINKTLFHYIAIQVRIS